MSRTTLALIALVITNSCGILFPGPSLPDYDEVVAAKDLQKSEWKLLEFCYSALEEDFASGKIVANNLILDNLELVRLPLLLQDIELQQVEHSALLSKYTMLEQQQQSALSALLLARVQTSREARVEWANLAIERDPDLVLAQVFLLGTRADDADTKVLKPLVRLLEEHPGCAEGWRLLAQLAPLYSRDDFAAAAASTEPWGIGEVNKVFAANSKAITSLRAHDPDTAIAAATKMIELDESMLTMSRMVTAAAFAQQQQPSAALGLVNKVLEDDPIHVVALFNRAILLRDYLGKSDDADSDLRLFLKLTASEPQKYLLRRTQAEYWLAHD
jgi:hypothetical protein